jgi:hypothetical protein
LAPGKFRGITVKKSSPKTLRMLVFSDTSPISCLASLGRLDLLEMYGQVRIVSSVEDGAFYEESVNDGNKRSGLSIGLLWA